MNSLMASRFEIEQDQNPADFLAQAGDLLYQNEAVNSLMLGLSEGLITKPSLLSDLPPWYLRMTEDGKTVSAALRTPPVNLILTYSSPEQLRALVKHVHKLDAELPGLTGPLSEVDQFSQMWCELTGKQPVLGMASRIYQATKITVPADVPGTMRPFCQEEVELLVRWMKEFGREAMPSEPRSDEVWQKSAERAIESQMAYLWLVDEEPVAATQVNRPTKNTITVNYVYTPKHLRRRGYASALVARVSEKWLTEKRACVLYTDLANPTSNKIYQNVGYREVADCKYVRFE